MLLELRESQPDWERALGLALQLPPGAAERRRRQDPRTPSAQRPRRISDDLAWLRQAYTHAGAGARSTPATEFEVERAEDLARVERLERRGITNLAGFAILDEWVDAIPV